MTRGSAFRSVAAKLQRHPMPWYLVGCACFLYLHLFRPPSTPVFTIGDQDVYLVGGMRMFSGQAIYRDFFDFLPPGTHLLYFLLFRIFGVSAWIPNLALIVLGVGLVWLATLISRRLAHGILAYLPGLVFLTFSFRSQLDATHHWYSAVAVLAALVAALDSRTPARVAAAGALCGVAAFFTQTRGTLALVGFAMFLLWETRKKGLGSRAVFKNEALLVSGFLIALGVLMAYFIRQAGLARVLDSTVIFLLRYSTAYGWNTWAAYLKERPTLHPWYRLGPFGVWLFMNLCQPVVYALCLWRYLRERRRSTAAAQTDWNRWMLVYLVGLSTLAGALRAPSALRLAADSLPVLILLVWLVGTPGRLEGIARRTLWLAAGALFIATPLARQLVYSPVYLDLPTGRTAFFDPDRAAHFEWFLERVHPGEYFFGSTSFNFYLLLPDPAQVPFVTTTDFTRPEQVQDLVESLERRRVPWVLGWNELEFDGPGSGPGDHLGPLRACLRERYHVVKIFVDGKVWQRN